MATIVKMGSSRVFTIKHRAGPGREPDYLELGAADAVSWGQGDVNKIEAPSDLRYNDWIVVDTFQASPDLPTGTLHAYLTDERSPFLELVRLRCAFDVQIHIGCGEDVRDFDAGWIKVIMMDNARPTSYDIGELGTVSGDNQGTVMKDLPYTSNDLYEVLRMLYRAVATSEVGEEVIAVNVCDHIICGDCDSTNPSDGCQRVFAVTNAGAASPGVLPQVIITTDQFGDNAIIERWITTFVMGENASDAACVGSYYVVISSDGEDVHYASITDIVNENETWASTNVGIVASSGPTAIWNYSPTLSFVCGLAGYIYRMKAPADGLTVLDAGVATTEDLADIDGWDTENVTAVGDAGSVINTIDGTNFTALTAPVGPTDLYAVGYRTKNEIWVGGDTGNVYYTSDYGVNWTTKALPGGLSQIDKIHWYNETVGWIAGRTSAPAGKILRTINGGYSWYVVPEDVGSRVPANDYFNDLATCDKDANKLFAGGLADNGGDGILVKGSD